MLYSLFEISEKLLCMGLQKVKQYLFIITFLISALMQVYSGEVAQYKIVGISGDSQYLAFAEYGINRENLMFANVSIVDIPQNAFIANGIRRNVYDVIPQIDQDGVNALLKTMLTNSALFKQYNIDLLNSGKLIYILLNGDVMAYSILFTDYDTDISYAATLSQHIKTTTDKTTGAFHIKMTITYNGRSIPVTLGSPTHYRANVKNYLIRSVYSTRDNTSLIFVIEKHMTSQLSKTDTNIYYMIETIKWRK